MKRWSGWLLLFAAVLGLRLTHAGVLWVEECYPAAAAIQILHGKLPYLDFLFDKPPLSAFFYLLWGAQTGWPLRLAGALFVLLCCWLGYRVAREMWGEREGWLAAALLAFFLTFDNHAAVMALAPDLLLLAPHLAAVLFAWQRRPVLAGLACAVGFLTNTKAVFVLAACLAWNPAGAVWTLLGFVPALAAVPAMWEPVLRYGSTYAADSFVADPWKTGLSRTAAWLGFHAAIVIPAGLYFWKERSWKLALWVGLALASVGLGLRFFPRYYFFLLPPVVLAGARGLTLFPKARFAALLLLIPLARFGPRYVSLDQWADLAMFEDSRAAAVQIQPGPGDTILVWGYRPDLLVLTRLPLGTPFLDSQPLTGVLADRHLFDSHATTPELAKENRARLVSLRPTVVVDGLGAYNPTLAISNYPDLAGWLGQYRAIGITRGCTIYRLIQP